MTNSNLDALWDKLQADGGFTANGLGYQFQPTAGADEYAVGLRGMESRICVSEFDVAGFTRLFDAYASILQPDLRPEYIGAWLDGPEYVFDVTCIITGLDAALAFARANGQKAIYSFDTGKTITVGPLVGV